MNALEWASMPFPSNPPAEFHCPTSDVWQGRFVKLAPLLIKKKIGADLAALFSSAIGEIGDNCFTHNAPGWIDTPGCWFEIQISESAVHCFIADRGRGILSSLKAVRPSLSTHRDALAVALSEQITGRAPEKRGNGLKYVISVLQQIPSGSFLLHTGNALFQCVLPFDKDSVFSSIRESSPTIRGTYCAITIHFNI